MTRFQPFGKIYFVNHNQELYNQFLGLQNISIRHLEQYRLSLNDQNVDRHSFLSTPNNYQLQAGTKLSYLFADKYKNRIKV